MLAFILSHGVYLAAAAAIFLGIFIIRRILRYRKKRQAQLEMSILQKRNDALNETLRNPKIAKADKGSAGPMEVQWDEQAVRSEVLEKNRLMVELVEFSSYSRRKYVFPAGETITVGSGTGNRLVLPREGVADRHCEVFPARKSFAVRSVPGEKTVLLRGKKTVFVSEEGVFLRNGDHIRMGSADIQFRSYKT